MHELSTADLQSARRSLPPAWHTVLAILFLLSGLVALVSGRATPLLLAAVVAVLLGTAIARGRAVEAAPAFNCALAAILAFAIYAAASAFWAISPRYSVGAAAALAAIAVGSAWAAGVILREPRSSVSVMATGLSIGFVVGVHFCLLELLAGHVVKVWVLETLRVPSSMWVRVRASSSAGSADPFGALNRSITISTVLAWPVLMITLGLIATRWRRAAVIVLMALVISVVMLSAHTTSKIAIVLGLAAFAFASQARRLTFYTFAAAWLVSCLAIVPAAQLPHQLDLHNAPWLKLSAQHRILIWSETAKKVRDAPMLGRGAAMSPLLTVPTGPSWPTHPLQGSGAVHPHNVFLQTWLELGFVGALLLLMAGLALLWRVRLLEGREQPFAYAMLACVAANLHASYGMWQGWYMSLFGLAVVWFALGKRALEFGSELSAERAR